MPGPAVCDSCGATAGVTEVVVTYPDGDRRLRMCPACKAERLERKRVRTRRAHRRQRRSVPGWLGYALLALGLVALLVAAAMAVVGGDDEPEPECYPGAGFSCPAG